MGFRVSPGSPLPMYDAARHRPILQAIHGNVATSGAASTHA